MFAIRHNFAHYSARCFSASSMRMNYFKLFLSVLSHCKQLDAQSRFNDGTAVELKGGKPIDGIGF